MSPGIDCIVICLVLVLAVFVIARDLKAFACFAANEKEDAEKVLQGQCCIAGIKEQIHV